VRSSIDFSPEAILDAHGWRTDKHFIGLILSNPQRKISIKRIVNLEEKVNKVLKCSKSQRL